MSRGRSGRDMPRAFDALSFEEERHALLGHAHQALAHRQRRKQLCRKQGQIDQALDTDMALDKLQQEMDENLDTKASSEVFADRATMLVVLAARGKHFPKCSLQLRADPEVALAAISSFRAAWNLTHGNILAGREGTLKVVKANGSALELAIPDLRDDADIVLAALEAPATSVGTPLEFASDRLRGDRRIVMAALHSKESEHIHKLSALRLASEEIQKDKDVVLAAVALKAWAILFASPALRKDKDIVRTALRSQTEDDLEWFGENVLSLADETLRADSELVLEAVKFDASALAVANKELVKNKDFLLRAARCAPAGQGKDCFDEADPAVYEETSWEHFEGAYRSGLALAGDTGPLLTVTLHPATQCSPVATCIPSCEVSLLSGASFMCSLPTPACCLPTNSGQSNQAAAQEPPMKRARVAEAPESSAQPVQHSGGGNGGQVAPLLVVDLAKILLGELPTHLEAQPSPKTVYIIFKRADDPENPISVTPWDWERPLTDFI